MTELYEDQMTLFGSGRNTEGQLGLGHISRTEYPLPIPLDNSLASPQVKGITCGEFHSLILTSKNRSKLPSKNFQLPESFFLLETVCIRDTGKTLVHLEYSITLNLSNQSVQEECILLQ